MEFRRRDRFVATIEAKEFVKRLRIITLEAIRFGRIVDRQDNGVIFSDVRATAAAAFEFVVFHSQ